MLAPTWLPGFLRFDAMLNVTGTLVLLVAAGPIGDVIGLSVTWPLYALAAVLAVNGAELLLTARDPRPGMLMVLAVVDAVFVVLVLAYTLRADGAETWARWAMFLIADATVLTAAAKLVARRRLPALA